MISSKVASCTLSPLAQAYSPSSRPADPKAPWTPQTDVQQLTATHTKPNPHQLSTKQDLSKSLPSELLSSSHKPWHYLKLLPVHSQDTPLPTCTQSCCLDLQTHPELNLLCPRPPRVHAWLTVAASWLTGLPASATVPLERILNRAARLSLPNTHPVTLLPSKPPQASLPHSDVLTVG